jgi:hypothetical protein
VSWFEAKAPNDWTCVSVAPDRTKSVLASSTP